MHEADAEPARDEVRLRVDDALEQRQRVIPFPCGLRVVAIERVLREGGERLAILAGGEVLERADTDVARGDAREHRAGQDLLAADGLARGDGSERARGGNAERMHGLADEVFAEDGPEGGAAVTAAREGRPAGALELDVAALAVRADHLAEENGAPVPELPHEAAELVAGVGERDGLRALGRHVAGEECCALRGDERICIDAEELGQRTVHLDDLRRAHLRGRDPGEEAVGQASVGVVERDLRHEWGLRGS